MKPIDGRWRLRWINEDGDVVEWTLRMKNGKISTPWGPLVYDASIDALRLGLIGLECTGQHTFRGINDMVQPPTQHEGTCEYLGP